ncbi:hypothetical protein [Neogemmobacter tilapiae]|uniref:Uncharacterized protein n=1 Tax=Neogemmobacter tilapiae TaxID=875041 RepID=A0A918TIY9_9RHOB|nr:hypothetical protein [Gemmobacter tilapiae]GHC50287.1 hypothetical protein GCM10007315_10670 [Gemmobacter tilapiae]
MTATAQVKTIGANGQLSLGKRFAGRHVIVEEQAEGVWVIRTAQIIPDSEAWIHEPKAAKDLALALAHTPKPPAAGDDELVLNRAEHAE